VRFFLIGEICEALRVWILRKFDTQCHDHFLGGRWHLTERKAASSRRTPKVAAATENIRVD
jgi:hypothetical protein